MNIMQAEALTGVSRPNIRFYERQGLLTPTRNPDNNYREYSDANIEKLKWIKAMRMLDMPLEDIGSVLDGTLPLSQAAQAQQVRLKTQAEKLEEAIRFCGTLRDSGGIASLNVDDCLRKMEADSMGYFQQWKRDFAAVSRAERKRFFTFTPDSAVTDPGEFAEALQAFADQNGMELDITKVGMYPVFTLNGVEYTAIRDYHRMGGYGFSVPMATICCEMTHPEDVEPDVPQKRKLLLQALQASLPGLGVLLLFCVIWLRELIEWGWAGLLLVISIAAMIGVGNYLFRRFHFNDKTK